MPFEKDDKGERTFGVGSLIKGAAIGAPIGIGVRKWWQETDFNSVIKAAKQPSIRSPYSRAYAATKDASFDFTSSVANRVSQWNFVELNNTINKLKTGKYGLSARDIKDALLRAAESSDPSGAIRTRLTRKLDLAQDPISVLEDINTISRTSVESIHMQRTVSSFLDNLNTLQIRTEMGRTLNPVTVPKFNMWKYNPVSIRSIGPQFEKTFEQISKEMGGMTLLSRVVRKGDPTNIGELQMSFFDSPLLGEQRFTKKGSKIPQLTIKLPSSLPDDPNMVIHGRTGQSKYIAGQFWNVERLAGGKYGIKSSMKYEEWAANRFLEQFIPEMQKQQRVSRSFLNQQKDLYHKSILQPLQWVETLNESRFGALERYINVRKQIAHLYGPAGESLSDVEYMNIMKQGIQGQKVFPGASPGQIVRNVVSLRDWRDIEPFGGAFDWGKRPLQRLRESWQPTHEAINNITRDRLSKRFSWMNQKYTQSSPMLRFAYVKSDQAARAAGYGMNIEGSGLISKSKAPLFSQYEMTRFNIKADQIYDLAGMLDDIENRTKWTLDKKVAPGKLLGYGLSGKPVLLEDEMRILEVTRHVDKQKGDFFKIVATKELSDFNQFKAFGGVKGMFSFISQRKMNKLTKDLFGFDSMIDPGINAVASIDELKKNRALHNKQMISALFDFTQRNMESGKQMGRHAGDFLNKPRKYIAGITKAAKDNKMGVFDNDIALRKMMRIAREGRLTPQQMGGAFGAVPDVFGLKAGSAAELKEEFMSKFKLFVTQEEAEAIRKGTPIGISQLSFGGLYGPGTGKRGTIEPRMFELLSSPHFGSLGPEIQEEIATRMFAEYPHRMSEQTTIEKALRSVISPKGKTGILPSKATFRNLMEEGGNINVPGIGDIFVPSKSDLTQLSTYTTPGGMDIESPLATKYEEILDKARALEQGTISKAEMQTHLGELQSLLHTEKIKTVTGEASLLRGRLLGSMFLTAMPKSNLGKVSIGKGEVGITKSYFKRMARDMEKVYGKEAMKDIKSRFLSGEAIGGMVARHPFIGPYSTNTVGLKMIPGKDARAVLGEEFLDTQIKMGGKWESAGALRFGPAVGMAADYDADIVNVMLASPNIEGKLLQRANDMADYEAYSIRAQLVKAKKAAGTPTLSEAASAAGAAMKLRVPQERLGLISETLQEARAAILMNQMDLSKQRSMNALGLLEWLEQTPISAKHIASGKEVEMISLLEGIRTSVRKRDTSSLVGNIRDIVGKGTTAERFLEEDIATRYREGNKWISRNVSGVKLEQAVGDIFTSLDMFDIPGKEGISPARYRQLFRGRGAGATQKEMEVLTKHPNAGMSAFSGFFSRAGTQGGMSEAVSHLQGLRNSVAAAGGKLIEHAAPVGLGFAAAVGIATLFSSPPKMMKGDMSPPTPQTGGTGGANIGTDVEPPEVTRGRPTMRGMQGFGRRGVVSTGNIGGTRLDISASSYGNIDYNQLNSQLSSSVNGLRVSSRVVDNRTRLTPQRISSIMEEE